MPYEYICWSNLLIDIDSPNNNIENIVKESVEPIKSKKNVINELDEMKISSHWFLDSDYSDEFNELLTKLKECNNLDKLINENKNQIFNEREIAHWKNMLIFCAYLKHVIEKKDEAEEIYGLALNEKLFDKFLTEILKRSIYEYLTLIKYNKSLNTKMFTDENISDKISYIEENWVKS